MEAIAVGMGGFFGAISRWLTYKIVHYLIPLPWVPVGTLTVNIVGSFLLSWLLFSNFNYPFLQNKGMLFLGTGFLGAFTTFSTFSFETMQLMVKSKLLGFLYAFGMLSVCLIAAWLGYKYAK